MNSRSEPLWVRLQVLRLPAAHAVAGGLSVVGGVVVGAAGVELEPGGRYRARLVLSGLAQLASKSRLVSEFEKLGFKQVELWEAPRGLPADWPALERGEASSGKTWWGQAVYTGQRKTFDPAQLEDDGVKFLWIARVDAAAAPGSTTTEPAPPAPPPPQSFAVPASSVQGWAVGVVSKAFGLVHQRSPSLQEGLFIAALCGLESDFGRAYGAAKNWGSVHAGKPPCGPGSILWQDSDGKGNKYPICMKAYASDEEGAADVVRQLTTRRPAVWKAIQDRRPLLEIAKLLHDGETVNGQRVYGYFEADPALYAKGLRRNLDAITKATGLPDPFSPAFEPASSGSGAAGVVGVLALLGLGALAAGRR